MCTRPLPSLPNIAEATTGSGSTTSACQPVYSVYVYVLVTSACVAGRSDDDPSQMTQSVAEVHGVPTTERRYLTNPRQTAASS